MDEFLAEMRFLRSKLTLRYLLGLVGKVLLFVVGSVSIFAAAELLGRLFEWLNLDSLPELSIIAWSLVILVALFVLHQVVKIGRELWSWLKVRRRTRTVRSVDPGTVLGDLCALSDPIGASEYLLHLRTQRTAEARRLPREFVRELADLIQRGGVPQNPMIRAAVESGRLDRTVLYSWRGDMLDEIGRLDEFLRER